MVASRCDLTVALLSPLQLGLPAQDLGKDEPIHRLSWSEEKLMRPSPSVRISSRLAIDGERETFSYVA